MPKIGYERSVTDRRLPPSPAMDQNQLQEMVSLEEETRELRWKKNVLIMKRNIKVLLGLKRDVGTLKSYLAVPQHGQTDMASLKKQVEELKHENTLLLMRQQEMASLKKELEELKQKNKLLLIVNQNGLHKVESLGLKLGNVKLERKSLLAQQQDGRLELESLKNELEILTIEKRALRVAIWYQNNKLGSLKAQLKLEDETCKSLAVEKKTISKNLLQHHARNVGQDTQVFRRIQHIAGMRSTFNVAKLSALEDCQKTTRKAFNDRLQQIEQQLTSTQAKLDHMTFLHAKACDERTARESELTKRRIAQLKTIVEEEAKSESDCLKTAQKEKQQKQFENTVRREVEPELEENTLRAKEIMVSEGTLCCLEGQLARLKTQDATER